LSKKSKGAEERLRVAKIFQIVSSTGHTLVSWAAAVNQVKNEREGGRKKEKKGKNEKGKLRSCKKN